MNGEVHHYFLQCKEKKKKKKDEIRSLLSFALVS